MPHGFVFSSRIRCNSWPSVSRSVIICASLCRPIDSRSAVWALSVTASPKLCDLEDGFLGVPHDPEHDRVHVHRHRVARQRGFGPHVGDPDALVHELAHRVHDRDDVEQARPAQSPVAAEPEHGHLLPLVRHLDGEHEIQAQDNAADDGHGVPEVGASPEPAVAHTTNSATPSVARHRPAARLDFPANNSGTVFILLLWSAANSSMRSNTSRS